MTRKPLLLAAGLLCTATIISMAYAIRMRHQRDEWIAAFTTVSRMDPSSLSAMGPAYRLRFAQRLAPNPQLLDTPVDLNFFPPLHIVIGPNGRIRLGERDLHGGPDQLERELQSILGVTEDKAPEWQVGLVLAAEDRTGETLAAILQACERLKLSDVTFMRYSDMINDPELLALPRDEMQPIDLSVPLLRAGDKP